MTDANPSYPARHLKGIPTKGEVDAQGLPTPVVFRFKTPPEPRSDSMTESSINWEDDDQAIPFTLNQRKPNGDVQFRYGVAIIPTSSLTQLPAIVHQIAGSGFTFERRVVDGNKYHGNYLILSATPGHIQHRIEATLSLLVTEVVKRDAV